MTSPLREFTLTAHITFSVGWFGAVAVFLAFAIAGVVSQVDQITRSAYMAMELSGWFVIVPFCLAALLTGLIQSLVTEWGLFRHYWIVVKLILTVIATIVLFAHMQPISYLASMASKTSFSNSELQGLRIQLVADAGAAMLVLLAATAISVYKPWGRIEYRLKKKDQPDEKPGRVLASSKSWKLYGLLALIGLVILLFIILHLAGGFANHA